MSNAASETLDGSLAASAGASRDKGQIIDPNGLDLFRLTMMVITASICGPDFKILSTAYADKTFNNSKRAYNKNVYLLYKHDPESVRLNLPVPYTTTQPATADGYTFTNKAYAQYSGVAVLRNRELYKMTF